MAQPPSPVRPSPWERLAQLLAKHRVEYLIIGKAGAILQGFPDTTQDIDLFPKKSPANNRRIVAALKEMGVLMDRPLEEAIRAGKDFIQIRGGPVDVDLVFAPDGLDSFQESKRHAAVVARIFPVASVDDIIKSKKKAKRQKDLEVLPRLEAFATYLRQR